MNLQKTMLVIFGLLLMAPVPGRADGLSRSGVPELVVAKKGVAVPTIIVAPEAGAEIEAIVKGVKSKIVQRPWERRAADDLQKYIEMMSGVRAPIAATDDSIAAAMRGTEPLLIVGQQALRANPSLASSLQRVCKKNPFLRADGIVLQRSGNRIYIAGSNDDSNYYAASVLLQKWGCRWYMPTDFGECIPVKQSLTVSALNYAYAPPFEVRKYWLSWYGDGSGYYEFSRRNLFNEEAVPADHAIGSYIKEIIPPGKSGLELSFSDPKTIAHVASKVEGMFARGERFSVGMEDGVYTSSDPTEEKLKAGFTDKYFKMPSMTEPFWVFYNGLARTLQEKYPQSDSKIGFFAYDNLTLPPTRGGVAEKSLVAYLAPIDIDPHHSMDDPRSPQRQEYREMMYRWAKRMDGRVVIYDYDQGNLVWRDIPDPSQYVFAQDVKLYRKAGILGISTESRGAMATTFLNLYFRGQLMWNPDADVDALLNEFYPAFYGPGAAPMKRYWTRILSAWKSTLTTEHEYMTIPAIYTPQMVSQLSSDLEAAEHLVGPLRHKTKLTRNEKLYLERMNFARQSFEVLRNYSHMAQAAASEADYAAAVVSGEKGLAARKALGAMNPTFTTTKLEDGYAFWDGEDKQYGELKALLDGSRGELVAKTPLQWSFRRDPNDTGLASGFAYNPVDLSYWNRNSRKYTAESLKDYPTTEWEKLRTDIYAQGQGIRHPDGQSFTGYMWYRTDLNLTEAQSQGKLHLIFPGLFNEAWLFINGDLVAHRTFPTLWWNSDYKFEWDVDVAQLLKPGTNEIAVRLYNPHHFGGMFRRPFLYRAID